MASLGFLTNLAALLRSPADAFSSLGGAELVASKVSELVVMGGRYPAGREWNFASDPESARQVLSLWPGNVPMTFSGYELGARIFSGARLGEWAERGSPVRAAYEWYGDRCNTTRASYDPVTVLYGGFGLGGIFEYGNANGYNIVDGEGRNAWVEDEGVRNQHWLKLREGVREEEVGEVLDWLFAHGTSSAKGLCFPGGYDGSMRMDVQWN